jgi:hypothetical protein
MGLFDRGKPGAKGGTEGTAVILESEANPGTLTSASESQAMFIDMNFLGSRKYRFALEVRLPEQDPYRVEGVFKVPKRAENTGLLETGALQPGIELPVRVDPGDPEAVEIDWDAYRSTPGRQQAHRDASASRQHSLLREQLEKDPKKQAKHWEANKGVVQAWVGAVQMGNLSREDFEQSVKIEVDSGRMDPADAEAARATLDG